MGVSDYLFDSNYRQRSDINGLEDRTARLENRQRHDQIDLSQRIWQLENENAEIKQVCVALLHCLSEQKLVTGAVFAQQLEAVRELGTDDAWRQLCPEIAPPKSPKIQKRNVDFTDAARAAEEMTPYEG